MMFWLDNSWKRVDESDFRCEVVLLLCKTEDHICSVCKSINKTRGFQTDAGKENVAVSNHIFFPEYFVD